MKMKKWVIFKANLAAIIYQLYMDAYYFLCDYMCIIYHVPKIIVGLD